MGKAIIFASDNHVTNNQINEPMKMKNLLLLIIATLGLTTATMAQNICQSIGNDSLALYNNGYITGPQNLDCGQNVHTETKWINVIGADSLFINTAQHRLYDFSKIYDQNNNLIWSWLGENGSPTWYFRSHSLFVGGNDSVRIEFHQGYSDPFCNGYIQVVGIYCSNLITSIGHVNHINSIKIYPNPANSFITIDYGNFAILNAYQMKIQNSIGQQVLQTNITQQTAYLSLNNWGGNGLYFVHIIDAQGNTIDIRKIVLQ